MGAFTAAQLRVLRESLLAWFDQAKRDLPWRRTKDPYAIWVSEIMLQQTRVAAVLDHYARWMARFPTIAALAEAEEPEVLALWSGLGYYRRARFLHAGARAVIDDHSGALPATAAELRTLPGIGEYTSAAIASIAFGEPVAVVDGNVERVMMRLVGLSLRQALPAPAPGSGVNSTEQYAQSPINGVGNQCGSLEQPPPAAQTSDHTLAAAPLARAVRAQAQALLDPARPGDFNQAMMELGATVCLPRAPLCLHCPVYPWCATRGQHLGASPKPMQSRTITYALARRERHGQPEVLLTQRPAGASLMPGMWELPELAANSSRPASASSPDVGSPHPILTLRHSITTTNYTVQIFASTARAAADSRARWTPIIQLPEIALTGLARKALKRMALWPAPSFAQS